MKRVFNGCSMKGTFCRGDLLCIAPTPLAELNPGDVVVFTGQGLNAETHIVHRVMRCLPAGLVTRGDAATHKDACLVTERNLVGRVVAGERNGRMRRIRGGWSGLCRGKSLHFYWRMRRTGVRWFRRPYLLLKESGVVPRFWRPRITRVMIHSTDGPCIQYVRNKRVVARSWPRQDRFECRKPWDLVIA